MEGSSITWPDVDRSEQLHPVVKPADRLISRVIVAGAVAVAVPFLYSVARHSYVPNSDNASALLAGNAMARGNVLLDGWILPHDSYWTLDLPLFGLFSLFSGVGTLAVYAVPVIVATALILLAAAAAGRGLPRSSGWLAAGVVVVLLGLPHAFQARMFLQGPFHVVTILICLAAFLLLQGASDRGAYLPVAALLGVAVLGDAYSLPIGVAPILGAGVLSGLRRRRWEPAAACGGVALLAVGGATLARAVLDQLPAHSLASPVSPSPPWNWTANVGRAMTRLFSLLGPGSMSDLSGLHRAVHFAGLLLVGAAVTATIVRLVRGVLRGSPEAGRSSVARWSMERSYLDDVLLFGFFGGIGAFILLASPLKPADANTTRYLLPTLVYGAVLAGRWMGGAVRGVPRPLVPVTAGVLVAVAGLYGWTSVATLRNPTPQDPALVLARWLEDNDLDAGFGQYWAAASVTVASEGSVSVRPVVSVDGSIRPKTYYSSADWYEPDRLTPRRFVVYLQTDHPLDSVEDTSATETFGPPSRSADVGPYRVLIWPDDITPRLRFPGAKNGGAL